MRGASTVRGAARRSARRAGGRAARVRHRGQVRDGPRRRRARTTSARTPRRSASVLEQQGIAVGAHDTVAPSPSTPLCPTACASRSCAGGPCISSSTASRTTCGRQPADVEQAWPRPSVTASRPRTCRRRAPAASRCPGSTLDVRMPQVGVGLVTAVAPAVIVTTAATVGGRAGAGGAAARVDADLVGRPDLGVPVARVSTSPWSLTGTRMVDRAVPIAVHDRADHRPASLYVGTSRCCRPGAAGLWSETWRYTLRDGSVVSTCA